MVVHVSDARFHQVATAAGLNVIKAAREGSIVVVSLDFLFGLFLLVVEMGFSSGSPSFSGASSCCCCVAVM